jgi:hypothetical protein
LPCTEAIQECGCRGWEAARGAAAESRSAERLRALRQDARCMGAQPLMQVRSGGGNVLQNGTGPRMILSILARSPLPRGRPGAG